MILPGIEQLQQGRPIIIYDDVSMDPCGYIAASTHELSEELMAYMINLSRGMLFAALPASLAESRGLSPVQSEGQQGTLPMAISIESRAGVTSGISAADRVTSLKALLNSSHASRAIVAPGHIFPVVAKNAGLLVRTGIAEAVCDALRAASLPEVGPFFHLLSNTGEPLTRVELEKIAATQNMPLVLMSSIIRHRLQHEPLVTKVCQTVIPTEDFGLFDATCFIATHDGAEHLVLSQGDVSSGEPILTRMHSEEKVGDIFCYNSSHRRQTLMQSLQLIYEAKRGVLVYIRKAGKNTIAQSLSSGTTTRGTSAYKTDVKELGIGSQILRSLNITKLRLLTSDAKLLGDLSSFNLEIVEQIALS